MKPVHLAQTYEVAFAPHTGAWIETVVLSPKQVIFTFAPHPGAWIETIKSLGLLPLSIFAPHTGAWIETAASYTHVFWAVVRTPHGCVD